MPPSTASSAGAAGETVGLAFVFFCLAGLAALIAYWVSPKTRATPILTPVSAGSLVALVWAFIVFAGSQVSSP